MHAYALPPWIGFSLTGILCVAAAGYGRWEERASAAGLAANIAFTILLRDWGWSGMQWGAFGADVLYLGLLVFIALRSERYWPLFAGGFQLLTILLHLGRLVDPKLNSWGYATAEVIFTYLVEYAILFGVISAWRMRRQLRAMGAAMTEPGVTRR